MPTNILSALVVAATWFTNSISETDGQRGNEWFRTNIVSVETTVAVVGSGFHAVYHTNPRIAVLTNTIRFNIVETSVGGRPGTAPALANCVTALLPLPPDERMDTNIPYATERAKVPSLSPAVTTLSERQAVERGLPPVPKPPTTNKQ